MLRFSVNNSPEELSWMAAQSPIEAERLCTCVSEK